MGTQIQLAETRVFDKDALGASNIKFFPGTSRDVTAEDLAKDVNKVISSIEAGEFEVVGEEEECA